MKNKKLIMILVLLMAIIGLYLYFAVNKAKAGTLPKADQLPDQVSLDPNLATQQTAQNPVMNMDSDSGVNVQSTGIKLPSWLGFLTGTSAMPGSTQYDPIYQPAKFPLRFGSEGTEVENLQKWLNVNIQIPYAKLDVDGDFGKFTQSALVRTVGAMEVSESWYKENILKA